MKRMWQFSRQMFLLSLVLVMAVATGCATRGYTDQRIGELDVRSSEAIARVRAIAMQNQSDIQTLTDRVSNVEQTLNTQVAQMQGAINELDGKMNNLQVGTSVAMTENVHFEFARYRLTNEAMATLDNLVSQLEGTPFAAIHLVGHTDSVGGETFNFNLGQRRAETVSAYLAQKGIDPHKLIIITLGEQLPVASNQDRSGRAQNRRVEMRVLQLKTASGGMM